jgi:signal transduction histidine kinase
MRDRAVLQAIIEHAPLPIAFRSPEGDVVLDNELHRRLVASTMAGAPRRWAEFFETAAWGDGRAVTPAEWEELRHTALHEPFEFLLQRTSSAQAQFVHWIVTAPVRADGRVLGTVTIVRDVSAEHAIRKLREELVAVIAHDLRSPIAGIAFSIEHAMRRAPDPEGGVVVPAIVLQRVLRSARHLADLVGELLDASRVELGAMSLDREDVDVRAFVSQVASDLAPSLRGRRVALDLPPQPVVGSVDRVRLTQVVTNLLDNASKYSREASTIHVVLREDGDTIQLSVRDEGEGIAPEDVPKLFDRFFQAKRARERKGGLGLGLYITKGLVEAHGGTLTVETSSGVGSTFQVRMPAALRARSH